MTISAPDLPWLALGMGLFNVALSAVVSCHVVLNKRDTRAALGWAGLVWLTPVIGSLLYWLLGINRIKRRAVGLRNPVAASFVSVRSPLGEGVLGDEISPHLSNLSRLVGELTGRPLLEGNLVRPLIGGREAYPAMLETIESSERSVALSTYIFDDDPAGERFADALARARSRGVDVRVIVDDVGARTSRPPILHRLRRAEISVSRFMPNRWPWSLRYANLRSHRKILVVDGTIGFTGGMNLREGNLQDDDHPSAIQDVHFRLEGPVVAHLRDVFAEDWVFTTGDELPTSFGAPLTVAGLTRARGISDGPDEDLDRLRWTLLGALACARSSVLVVTPYFLPDSALIMALNVAAMRGVNVDVVIPERGNLALVQWASTATLWQVLQRGCRVWASPPPFDHTKLMVVDGQWSLFGSANWDPRSLRLNFEFDVECYDRTLGESLTRMVRSKIDRSRPILLADVDGRPLVRRIRDGFARLLTPFL